MPTRNCSLWSLLLTFGETCGVGGMSCFTRAYFEFENVQNPLHYAFIAQRSPIQVPPQLLEELTSPL